MDDTIAKLSQHATPMQLSLSQRVICSCIGSSVIPSWESGQSAFVACEMSPHAEHPRDHLCSVRNDCLKSFHGASRRSGHNEALACSSSHRANLTVGDGIDVQILSQYSKTSARQMVTQQSGNGHLSKSRCHDANQNSSSNTLRVLGPNYPCAIKSP